MTLLTVPVVETVSGRVSGQSRDGVQVFLGLSYGATTGGTNRFRPPQPLKSWTGVRDAMSPGPSAPQLARPENTDPFYSWYSSIQPISEDCLCLNIFTPATDGAKRPVMVWIHGGGWREYAGSAPGFDGSRLARTQDVVVVTLNHRLNVFGHVALEDDEFPDAGNAGALDIVAALEWLRDNIASFGGDPSCVTLFGESGGGSKIAALLGMRRAKGLFHRAIVQSTAGGMTMTTPEAAAEASAALARVLGVPRLDGRALQALPLDVLLRAQKQAGGAFRGMIDNRSFDSHPFDGAATEVSAQVPLLIGCTDSETTYHMRPDPANFALDTAEVQRRIARFLRIDPDHAAELLSHYADVYSGETPSGLLIRLTTDYIFKRTNWGIAGLQAALGGAPVHAYLFGWHSPIEGGRMRGAHTMEVPFIFGTTRAAAGALGDSQDLAPLEARMMATWAAFARTGNPNNPDVPDWPAFDPVGRPTMILDTHSEVQRDPGHQARDALARLPWFGYGHSLPSFTAF